MVRSALPPHLDSDEEIEANFKDDSQFAQYWWGKYYAQFRKTLKPWLAFGPRATEWWARWRQYPITIFAIKSKEGQFRFESDESHDLVISQRVLWWRDSDGSYLSRNQYYAKWHFQICWPFFIAFHCYTDGVVLPELNKPVPDMDGKLKMAYFGAKRDADIVLWFPALYIGENFK